MLFRRQGNVIVLSAALFILALCLIVLSAAEIRIVRSDSIYRWASRTWASPKEMSPHDPHPLSLGSQSSVVSDATSSTHSEEFEDSSHSIDLSTSTGSENLGFEGQSYGHPQLPGIAPESHHELSSHTTLDGRYFLLKFGEKQALNPNIIPHPDKPDTWIIVAQQYKTPQQNQAWFTELVCEATFQDGSMQCLEPPTLLPITSTSSPHCTGDLDYFEMNIGPHDARVFPGPDHPFIIYGSQSRYNCFGLWIQDFRRLVDWRHGTQSESTFRHATDLQRPAPYAAVEKNWFVFWDSSQQIYAHYDVYPRRAFAQVNWDGSVGEDLAHLTRDVDDQCMERYLGSGFAFSEDRYHQATNSLAVTMCNRNDPTCERTADNTFIVSIFQKKTHLELHSVYEPFVMMFKQTPPFEIHALSTKPLWIRGRRTATKQGTFNSSIRIPPGQSEMLYVTSMTWKDSSRSYHGYLDDVMFLNFGIEDSQTGAIDVLASDLLAQLGICVSL